MNEKNNLDACQIACPLSEYREKMSNVFVGCEIWYRYNIQTTNSRFSCMLLTLGYPSLALALQRARLKVTQTLNNTPDCLNQGRKFLVESGGGG